MTTLWRPYDKKYRPQDDGTPRAKVAIYLYDNHPYSCLRVFEHWYSVTLCEEKSKRLAITAFTDGYEALKKELGVV